MGGKNFIGSFSYNVKDSEIIDECTRIAKQDGISFSEFIVACLKEQVIQKKVVGQNNPLNISYGKLEEKPFQSDLTAWFDHVDSVNKHQELNKLKGQALALCKRVDKRSMELYRSGIKS
jgi:hypothetical protein